MFGLVASGFNQLTESSQVFDPFIQLDAEILSGIQGVNFPCNPHQKMVT